MWSCNGSASPAVLPERRVHPIVTLWAAADERFSARIGRVYLRAARPGSVWRDGRVSLRRGPIPPQQVTWRTAAVSWTSAAESRAHASAVGRMSSSTPRRRASSITSGATGRRPSAPVPTIN